MTVYYNIGDIVKYMSGDTFVAEEKLGIITEISSDNFDIVKVEKSEANGTFLVYWSKKTKSFRPVKEKDLDSIFYTVTGHHKPYFEYIEPRLITECVSIVGESFND